APEPERTPEPQPVAAAAPVADEDDDDALELTQKVETHGDLDVLEPTPAPTVIPPPSEPGLVGDLAASAAAAAFGQLSATIAMPAEGRTLEDVVRELLRPLLQQWLDANLPGVVQQ